jgi:hypothetical protein
LVEVGVRGRRWTPGARRGEIPVVSVGGRGQARQRTLRRAGIAAAVLAVLALLFLLGGHWVIGIVLAVAAAAAVWVALQLRTVR